MTSPAAPAITVRSGRVLRSLVVACFSAEVLFVLLDATINHARWTDYGMLRRLCNIAREDGLASWFATTQTLLVGLTLWLIYMVARRDGSAKRVLAGWWVLACFFTYLAIDDGAEIHERLGSALKKAYSPEFYPSYAWQILFLPIFGAVGIFMLLFLWKQLKPRSGRTVLLVALALLSIGVAMDFVEGLDETHRWNAYTWIANTLDLEEFSRTRFDERPYEALRHFSKSAEEFLEMLATTLLWVVFLSHFFLATGELHLSFADLPLARPKD